MSGVVNFLPMQFPFQGDTVLYPKACHDNVLSDVGQLRAEVGSLKESVSSLKESTNRLIDKMDILVEKMGETQQNVTVLQISAKEFDEIKKEFAPVKNATDTWNKIVEVISNLSVVVLTAYVLLKLGLPH
jgi:uncharacterized phage infection (PIP) family protein YhgE